jgi:hypothetical protein
MGVDKRGMEVNIVEVHCIHVQKCHPCQSVTHTYSTALRTLCSVLFPPCLCRAEPLEFYALLCPQSWHSPATY